MYKFEFVPLYFNCIFVRVVSHIIASFAFSKYKPNLNGGGNNK